MRLFLLPCLLLCPLLLNAASLNGCQTSVRVGQRLLHTGDDLGRTLNTLRSQAHQLQWQQGPRGKNWVLTQSGRNPRTIHVQLKGGRIKKLCQYTR